MRPFLLTVGCHDGCICEEVVVVVDAAVTACGVFCAALGAHRVSMSGWLLCLPLMATSNESVSFVALSLLVFHLDEPTGRPETFTSYPHIRAVVNTKDQQGVMTGQEKIKSGLSGTVLNRPGQIFKPIAMASQIVATPLKAELHIGYAPG